MKRKHRKQVVKPKSRQGEIWRKYDPIFETMQEFSNALQMAASRETRFIII